MIANILFWINRAALVGQVWERLRPGKTFSGMSQETFREKSARSVAIRTEIQALETRLRELKKQRDIVDAETVELVKRIEHAVIADPQEGRHGTLYAEMGFNTKARRQRRRRVNGTEPETVATPGEGAADSPAA